MNVTLDTLESADLSLVGACEGRYQLSGAIQGWREGEPRRRPRGECRGASLSGLLQESGLSLPGLPLGDGVMVASTLAGKPTAPTPPLTWPSRTI